MIKPKLDPAPGFDPNDDSDAALWAAFRYRNRRRKESRLEHFKRVGKAELETLVGDTISQHTEYHYSFLVHSVRIDYWPSSSRWRYKNKTFYGNHESIMGFVRKRLNKERATNA